MRGFFFKKKSSTDNLELSTFLLKKLGYRPKNIQLFIRGGWHFNNILSPEEISLKLKTFAHSEFSSDKFSSIEVIKEKISKKIDLFDRNHKYQRKDLDSTFPRHILENKEKFKNWIL